MTQRRLVDVKCLYNVKKHHLRMALLPQYTFTHGHYPWLQSHGYNHGLSRRLRKVECSHAHSCDPCVVVMQLCCAEYLRGPC